MATKKEENKPELEEKKLKDMTLEEQKAYWNEKVPFRAFKDSGKYKNDIIVGVNGKFYQIQRGKSVMIPRCVREIIEQSERQDTATADMIDEMTNSYREESAARNINI